MQENTEPSTRTVFVPDSCYKVLRAFLYDGATNKQIGKRLYLTEDTIKTHMRRAMAKLGARDRVHLAIMVFSREVDVVHIPRTGQLVGTPRHLLEDVTVLRRFVVIDTNTFTG